MTLEQLEQKVNRLADEVAALRRELATPHHSSIRIQDTFGMFADDPEFEDVVRLGREYRDEVNSEDE